MGLTAERGGLTISWEFDPSYADYLGWGNDLYNIGVEAYDYAKYGFYITKNGQYAIVHGAHTKAAFRRGIYGTRYSFKNAGKYPEVFSYVDPKTAAKSAFALKTSSGKVNWGGAFNYGMVILDVGLGVYDNVQAGTRPQKIVSDAIVDAGVGAGTIALVSAAGAAIGSIVPVAGNVVGAIGRCCCWFRNICFN